MKLLIADDLPANLRLLRAQLEAEGHQVAEASNGREGLEQLRKQPFDGVISDILMPEMDGYRFCIEVRGDAALRDLPFVLYTSTYISPADRQLAFNAGADAYISKPAPVPKILQAIEEAGTRKRPRARGMREEQSFVLKEYSEVLVRKLEDKNLELEASLDRLGLAHAIDQAIIAGKPPAQVAEAVLPRLRSLLGVERASVTSIDPETGLASWLAVAGGVPVAPGTVVDTKTLGVLDGLQRGEVQFVDVASRFPEPGRADLLAAGVRRFGMIPIFARERLVGSLNFGGTSVAFSPGQLEVAREVGTQLAIAIHQSRLDQRAREADAQYRMIFENVPLGITLTNAAGRIVSGNEVMARMLGYDTVEEAIRALQDHAGGIYVNAGDRLEYVRRLRVDGTVRDYEVEFLRRDGSRFWASLDGRLIDGPDGAQLVTIAEDITMRKIQEQRIARLSRMKDMQSSVNAAVARIRERQALLDRVCGIAVENGGFRAAWVAWHDPARRSLHPLASAGALDDFLDVVRLSTDPSSPVPKGIAARVVMGGESIVTNDVTASAEIAFRDEAIKRGFKAALHLPLKAAGEVVGVLILLSAETGVFDDEERGLLDELASDVSLALESMQKSEQLEYLAYYDALTGLPNRSLFHDRLAHSLRPRGGDATMIAVALLDVERFRRVNETLGRVQGDALLSEIGGRLHALNDSTARLGADMFALILRGARNAAEVNRALEAIVSAAFARPARIGGEDLRVSCRVGLALYPADGADADALLRNAEAALRRSKRSGDRVVFYAAEMNAQVADALTIENKLRLAIEQREFVLHYQPKVALADGRIVGAEALIRWQDPEKGLVPPGRFIPVLEETGLIIEVGRWALERAYADLNAWARQGIRPFRVAVNVSSAQLQRRDFVDAVIEEIANGGDQPELLELEITESLVMRNVEDSTRKLSILRGMGVTVAIDDFGTGYSSLAYLARLPVDKLKIDRSFISTMAASGESTMLVTTMIGLAHGLKLSVVAEGVETEEQSSMLRLFRCDEAQGYLFSKPLPAADFAALMLSGARERG